MRRVFFSLFVAICLSVVAIYRTDGFSLEKIHGVLSEGEASPPSSEILAHLQQPYFYLAKGRQCFVFASADGRFVIKFLNYGRFTLPAPLRMVPWMEERLARRSMRFGETLESFRLASNVLAEETGFLYSHLQEGGKLPILTIRDHAHGLCYVDLNHTVFILQKRAIPIYEELENRWRAWGQKGLEEGIASFVDLLERRCALNIADDDCDVEINFGFAENKALLIDPGRIFVDPSLQGSERREQEIQLSAKRLRKWLLAHHPESVAFLDNRVTTSSSPTWGKSS